MKDAAGDSLERGLAILSLFSRHKQNLTVKEMSDGLSIPLSSTYRIVQTLEQAGFIAREGARSPFHLGISLLRLGTLVQDNLDVRAAARPVMIRLAEQTGDTSVLVVPFRNNEVVCIEKVEGSYPIRAMSYAIGERRPYNGGAVALAVLAYLPEEQRQMIIQQGMKAVTDKTLVARADIEERCHEILRTGVSFSRGEVVPGSAAVAAPIFNAMGDVAGAIAIAGIAERIVDLDETIRDAADEVSLRLGWEKEQNS